MTYDEGVIFTVHDGILPQRPVKEVLKEYVPPPPPRDIVEPEIPLHQPPGIGIDDEDGNIPAVEEDRIGRLGTQSPYTQEFFS